ncbi:MAG: GNAT family N-acetyltransferase [Methylococcales bacterium]
MALSQEFVLADKTKHNLKSFDCGKPDMNQYLARFALKNMGLGLNNTWVLPFIDDEKPDDKANIAAYFTLATSTVTRDEIPTDKKLPGYPVPVVLLARLAVDGEYKKQGLGDKTLITALRKAAELTEAGLPAHCLILDVLDEDALTYYQRFEMFTSFTDDPMRLFVPMHVVKQI